MGIEINLEDYLSVTTVTFVVEMVAEKRDNNSLLP